MDTLPIYKAVEVAGSQSALAALVGVNRSTVNSWVKGRNRVSAPAAKRIEEKTGVSRKELRPDLFA